jgi:hypothetical protein
MGALAEYRQQEESLQTIRLRSDGRWTEDEEPILNRMDEIWKKLTDAERSQLNREGPQPATIREALP